MGWFLCLSVPGPKAYLSHLFKYTCMATCLLTMVSPHVSGPLSITTFNTKVGNHTGVYGRPVLIKDVWNFVQLKFLVLCSSTNNEDLRLVEIETFHQKGKSWL